MTLTAPTMVDGNAEAGDSGRFRLHRAGILNVWQYDDQEFSLADGRMLLRGANGAGKSKTLEMLLPFALDGDKARITASARHHTSLLWLMTDGYEGQARVGYVWVEFLRPVPGAEPEAFTCGVGIRASASARTATAWFFTTAQRVGHDLHLEDDGGPLSRPRLEEAVDGAGQVFTQAVAYKEHVGRTLFGLEPAQYDEVLRLLYWLRQPQVGEDIEPARLAGQLAQALPQLDEHAVKAAGDTFDELTAYGEQIERRAAAADALTALATAYAAYARSAVAERGRAVVDALREERRLRTGLRRAERTHADLAEQRDRTWGQRDEARSALDQDRARIRELEDSPEARDQRRLGDLAALADQQQRTSEQAGQRLTVAQDAVARQSVRVADQAVDLLTVLAAQRVRARELDVRQRDAGVGAPVATPAVLDLESLDDPHRSASLGEGLASWKEALGTTRAAVGRRLAAVRVVTQSLGLVAEAQRRQEQAEHRAEDAERRWEQSRERRVGAQTEELERAAELADHLAVWAGQEGAPDLPESLPSRERADELTAELVMRLPDLAREAAAPALTAARGRLQAATTARDNVRARVAELTTARAAIEVERDPSPPPPALERTQREDGRGLWQLVDFADDITPTERAGLEAALQASGLLDAWVRPGGRLLDPDTHDVVLAAAPTQPGPSAADVLRPDLPSDGDLSVDDVDRVLRGLRLISDADLTVDDTAAVGTDGTWRLGPLHGRARKERAQHIGATARAEERRRRLATIDADLADQRSLLAGAEDEIGQHQQTVDWLEAWLRNVPQGQALRAAWTRTQERREAEDREAQSNAAAQEAAHLARGQTARLRSEAETLALQHAVPLAATELEALDERLRGLDSDLGRAADAIGPARGQLDRWAADALELARSRVEVEEQREQARRLAEEADRARARLDELRAAVGATVRELEERLVVLRAAVRHHDETADRAEQALLDLAGKVGQAGEAVHRASEAIAEHAGRRAEALSGLEQLASVPGLLAAAAGDTPVDTGALAGLAELPGDQALPAAALALAEVLAGLSGSAVDPSRVWLAYQEAVSGPGADHEPTVATYGELLAVAGRDDAGEGPLADLATRVSAAVQRDRQLLTDRERQRFEQHVLGELGDAVRRCRFEAEELVAAMNQLLGQVTTSQGIRVRLDWRLRDDVPAEAREAVRLLGQPVGALLPEERATLRDALHRLIEASRAERPELSYGEHLSAALDYRLWFAFKIRYTRPESAGSWLDLHRRSPLSQGEQKVLCYLPLFAAAAAHFSSLAGAAPHAPRLVLLDDAFPKIDVRTHPLLFGLLVQLDLDFVITSERLWGDHDTVPSLAIYEALRDPMQRGIAQYEYRWDGRQLRSLG